MSAVSKTVCPALRNRRSRQGQSSPSELEWLHAGMAVMGATRESCTWTDLKHQVGVKEAGGPVSRSRPATADGPRPV